jgi:hypothetical protein
MRESLACLLPPRYFLQARGAKPEGGPYPLVLVGSGGEPIPLGGPHAVGIFLSHQYAVVPVGTAGGSWRVHSRDNIYELTIAEGRTLLRYDWHPDSDIEGGVLYPHLHLRCHVEPVNLTHAHLPTGRVALEAVIRFALRDLEVPPQRSDWADVLDRNEQAFIAARTWG